MARKAFLLRIDPVLLEALERWAEEDLRSLNGQIEYLLRSALVKHGRQKAVPVDSSAADESSTMEKSA